MKYKQERNIKQSHKINNQINDKMIEEIIHEKQVHKEISGGRKDKEREMGRGKKQGLLI